MAGPESKLWTRVRPLLCVRGWHVQRHEDSSQAGIPDVSYGAALVNGWLELKVTGWPVRSTTTLNLRHFTEQQREWLEKRGERGGHCFLLTSTPEWTMLHRWDYVRQVDTVPAPLALEASVAAWEGDTPAEDLRYFLLAPEWA